MRRRATTFVHRYWGRAVCYLLGGTVVAIVVAWFLANGMSAQDDVDAATSLERDGLHLMVQTTRSPWSAYVSFNPYSDRETAERMVVLMREMALRRHATVGVTDSIPGWALSVLDSYAPELPPPKNTSTSHVAVSAMGWPCLCVKTTIVDVRGSGAGPWVGNFIPLRPLLVGTIVNTALYSVLALGLLLIPRAIRRSSRERRGLCPSCGYPRHGLATNAACPECGSVPHSGHLASAARLRRS